MCVPSRLSLGYTDGHTGVALYRALLRQARKVPHHEHKNEYEDLVKRITRRNAKEQGHRDITTSLNVGYKVGHCTAEKASVPAQSSQPQ